MDFEIDTEVGQFDGSMLPGQNYVRVVGWAKYRDTDYRLSMFLYRWKDGKWRMGEDGEERFVVRVYKSLTNPDMMSEFGIAQSVPKIELAFNNWVASEAGQQFFRDAARSWHKTQITMCQNSIRNAQEQIAELQKKIAEWEQELARLGEVEG